MIWFILIAFLTIIISANCSLYEAVLYSTRLGTLESAQARGQAKGTVGRMIWMKRHIAGPIAAILILNTVANTAGATVSGMLAAEHLGKQWVPLFSVGLTLAILIFSEIIPKTVGAVHWRGLWAWVVWPMVTIRIVMAPFTWMVQKLSHALMGRDLRPSVTEEDILGAVQIGQVEGEITKMERRMLENVIRLEDHRVREIMTPRKVIFSLSAETPVSEAHAEADSQHFSRIPVYGQDREDVIGYVLRSDLGSVDNLSDPNKPIGKLSQPIGHLPEHANCLTALTHFLSSRCHLAVVIDEYGGLAGLVTLEDVLETLIGAEIMDETDWVADMQEKARRDHAGPDS